MAGTKQQGVLEVQRTELCYLAWRSHGFHGFVNWKVKFSRVFKEGRYDIKDAVVGLGGRYVLERQYRRIRCYE